MSIRDKEVMMTKSEEDLEKDRRQMAQGQTGGRATRGPETTTTGDTEAQGAVPPYEAPDSEEAKAAAQEGVQKAFRAEEHGGEPGPTPPVSKEESEGVPPTDTTAATPLGVGESVGESAEDIAKKSDEPGRIDTGPQGETQRPSGTSTGRDVTGIDPSSSPMHESEVTTDDADKAT